MICENPYLSKSHQDWGLWTFLSKLAMCVPVCLWFYLTFSIRKITMVLIRKYCLDELHDLHSIELWIVEWDTIKTIPRKVTVNRNPIFPPSAVWKSLGVLLNSMCFFLWLYGRHIAEKWFNFIETRIDFFQNVSMCCSIEGWDGRERDSCFALKDGYRNADLTALPLIPLTACFSKNHSLA